MTRPPSLICAVVAKVVSALALWFTATVASAQVDNFGCTALLCISNPAGPEAVPQCVEPIGRLKSILRSGGAFPTCEDAQGVAEVKKAPPNSEECPSGLSELGPGQTALREADAPRAGQGFGLVAPLIGYTIPEQAIPQGIAAANYSAETLSNLEPPRPRICVGQFVGTTTYLLLRTSLEGNQAPHNPAPAEQVKADVYETVAEVAPYVGKNRWDIYINGRLYRTVNLDD